MSSAGETVEDSSGAAAVGTSLTDLLPLPTTTQPVSEPEKQEAANSLAEEPTLSHALAMDDHDEKGLAQQYHDDEVVDLGWNEQKNHIAAPLVGGMNNDDLWLLIRRFNKQIYHVREVQNAVPGNLDLNVADEEEFSPDKLRATVERFYMTVIIGLLAAVKHVARLRSWRESRRTAGFCTAYFVAWILDLITPLAALTLITLIVYPPSRGFLFPPAPIALVDSKSGGMQKPKAGVLGSHDSATGAPENHKGEAVEKEAKNFFNGFTSVVITSATGKHPQADPETPIGGSPDDAVPDPTGLAVSAAEAKDAAAGGQPGSKHDKTKVPMENMIWNKMRPIMHGITDVADTYERFANALSPTAPFPQDLYRLRLAGLVVPLLLVSFFVSSYMFMKGVTFGAGFGFFGDPVITRGLEWLNRRYPAWQKLLEMRNTVLKGVPTNAQLTITLLRIGEANKAPLPPPPHIKEPPPERPAEITDSELRATGAEAPLNATEEELEAAMEHDPRTAHETDGPDIDAAKGTKHGRKTSKIMGLFKGSAKGAVKAVITGDAARAKIGSHHARNRLGATLRVKEDLVSGPVDFKARYKGHKGNVYITTKSTIPAVAFSTDATIEKIGSDDREDLHPQWTVAIGDIRDLKKIGGFGWKAKMVVGWTLGREVADGLEITDRTGTVRRITAVPLRDELFNRLIAIGGQKWEAW
ncbi:Uu.00g135310.m01.CDS01 [Anthostomella pinea]|uniref:Uu.00g135310.m01.CDS01 n=1 Tax=Anthostomella pinea TaxID=933095 RepID=A0AAI8YIH5_9PEZI|nr:Uu.00g135310.m01.CDS01 [Anthostomella pinea]